MPVKTKGFREVSDYFDKMSKLGDKTVNKALNDAGNKVREIEADVAKNTHRKYSERVGYNEIKKYPIRTGKMGSKYVSVGIKAKATSRQKGHTRSTHWDRVKGLLYSSFI